MNAAALPIAAPDAADRDERGPTRRCCVSGRVDPRDGMIRFVVGPDGMVVPDLAEKLPGRGLWVAADGAVLARADHRAFARAARAPVVVPEDLARRVEAALAQRLRDAVGMARRAGALVAGFEKTRAALRGGTAHLLIAAADGAADGRAKLRALAPSLPMAVALTASELGAAIGRDHVVHAAVTDAALARRIARETARLAGLRGIAAGDARNDNIG